MHDYWMSVRHSFNHPFIQSTMKWPWWCYNERRVKKREADQSLSEVNKITNGTDNRFDNFHASHKIVKMIMFTSFKLNINTHWCSFLKQENCSKPSGKTLPVWNINNLRLLCRRREKQFVTSTGQQDSGICCCLLLRRALVLLLFFYIFCMKHRNSSTWMNRWS